MTHQIFLAPLQFSNKQLLQNIQQELRAGDVLLIVGAGDIEQLAEWARR